MGKDWVDESSILYWLGPVSPRDTDGEWDEHPDVTARRELEIERRARERREEVRRG